MEVVDIFSSPAYWARACSFTPLGPPSLSSVHNHGVGGSSGGNVDALAVSPARFNSLKDQERHI
jgi:hypothetical protein